MTKGYSKIVSTQKHHITSFISMEIFLLQTPFKFQNCLFILCTKSVNDNIIIRCRFSILDEKLIMMAVGFAYQIFCCFEFALKKTFLLFQYVNQTFPREDTSTNFLPHISERELPDGK